MSLSNLSISPVLSPDGRPMFSVGGGASWKTGVRNGFVCSLEWMRLGKHIRPVMCIWPASNIFVTGEGAGIWTITRNAITDFIGFNSNDKCTGGASEHCFREAKAALPILGKDPNDRAALHDLVDVVLTYGPELVLMPVAPKHVRAALDTEAMWDVQAVNKNSGKVLSEASV